MSLLKKLSLITSLFVLVCLVFAFFNAYQLPVYEKNLYMLPFALYIDLFLIYVFTYKLRGKSNYPYIIFFAASALVIPAFLGSLFFGFLNWSTGFTHTMFSLITLIYIPKIFAFIFLIIPALIDIVRYKILRIRPRYNIVVQVILGFVFLIIIYGLFATINNARVNKETIVLKALPEEFNDLKIVHISDLHLGSWLSTKPIKRIVNIINGIEPDLVFITGDIINFHPKEIERFRHSLQDLQANYGIYSVLGNHDYGQYINWQNEQEKIEALNSLISIQESFGWEVLLNENRVIEIEKSTIVIAGVENWGSKKRYPKIADIDKALEHVDTNQTILLLAHDPSYWDMIIKDQYDFIDITFSGHTHGMQMGLSNKLSLARLVFKYWGGLYYQSFEGNHTYLHVNQGIGFLGFPGRIGVRPEISVITLKTSR